MSYTFGDATLSSGYTLGTSDAGFNYGGTPDYGFDLGVQDLSIDDFTYTPTAAPSGSGWNSLTDTLGTLWNSAGDWANTYVNKLIDKEVFGDAWNQPAQNQGTVTPVNTVDPVPAGFAVDNKTLMIGAGVVLALVLLSRK